MKTAEVNRADIGQHHEDYSRARCLANIFCIRYSNWDSSPPNTHGGSLDDHKNLRTTMKVYTGSISVP